MSAENKKAIRVVAILIIAKEVLGVIATLFAPMHLLGAETTVSDTWHIILTAIGVLICMFPAIIFGAKAFGKRFFVFSIVTILVLYGYKQNLKIRFAIRIFLQDVLRIIRKELNEY